MISDLLMKSINENGLNKMWRRPSHKVTTAMRGKNKVQSTDENFIINPWFHFSLCQWVVASTLTPKELPVTH